MTKEITDMIAAILAETVLLTAGIVLVGFGSNFYLAIGIACLLVYNKAPAK